MTSYLFTMQCPDRPGIVAGATRSLADVGANITASAQFSDAATSTFCMRTEFDVDVDDPGEVARALDGIRTGFDAVTTVRAASARTSVLVMVSKYDHCLLDLLYRTTNGELGIEIVGVVSNHPDLEPVAASASIPYHHVHVDPDARTAAEDEVRHLVDALDVDLVVLARYMQILSNDLCNDLRGRAINIHHSFLPAFKGGRPYHQAWERGVKVIGATAHYVTADLDEGPIIAQGVEPVSHRDSADRLVALGRDIERRTLSRAVALHAEGRVFLLGDGRTVVLD